MPMLLRTMSTSWDWLLSPAFFSVLCALCPFLYLREILARSGRGVDVCSATEKTSGKRCCLKNMVTNQNSFLEKLTLDWSYGFDLEDTQGLSSFEDNLQSVHVIVNQLGRGDFVFHPPG